MVALKITANAVLLAGFLLQPAVAADEAVEQVLAKAETTLQAARNAGSAWTSTDKLMAEARDALAAGDGEAAMELAQRALLTAERALEQPQLDANAWQARVPTP